LTRKSRLKYSSVVPFFKGVVEKVKEMGRVRKKREWIFKVSFE